MIYNEPENYGLRTIGQVDWPGSDAYGFSMTVVWQHTATGYLYMATDQGYSCPSPFENYDGIADLTPIDRLQTLIDDLGRTLNEQRSWNEGESMSHAEGDVGELVQTVREAWKNRPPELAEHWDKWWTDARRMATRTPGVSLEGTHLFALCPDGIRRDLFELFPPTARETTT